MKNEQDESGKASPWRRPGLRTISELFDIGPGVAILVLSATAAVIVMGFVLFLRSAPPTKIAISSGPEGSSFHRTALKYAKALGESGVKVNVLTSNGSVENLERILDPKAKVDLALIQSGVIVDDPRLERAVSLGGISNQPIFLFYRGARIEHLAQVRGKKIAVGLQGSGTRKIALRLLELNGIKEQEAGPGKLLSLDNDEAVESLENGKIDAAFIMSESGSLKSLSRLMRSRNVRLLSFRNASAYARKIDYLNVLELPQGIIDFGQVIPETDISLVGPMVELVAVKGLHPALSDLILDAATTIHGRAGLFQKRGEFPMPTEQTIPLSDDATRFYKSGKTLLYRHLPFWLASLFNRVLLVLLPMAVILIPAMRSVPAIFRWSSQIRISRLYRTLLQVEEQLKHETDPARIAELYKQFDRIDIAAGRMKVRPAFANEFYSLRLHIDYVRKRRAQPELVNAS